MFKDSYEDTKNVYKERKVMVNVSQNTRFMYYNTQGIQLHNIRIHLTDISNYINNILVTFVSEITYKL